MTNTTSENIASALEVLKKLPESLKVLTGIVITSADSNKNFLQDENKYQLLAPKQAAAILNVSISLLEKWRRDGKGPAWIRLEGQRAVRYHKSDLLKFISSRKVGR